MPLAVLLAVVIGVLAIDRPRKRADVVMLNGGDASTLDVTRVSWQQDNRIVGSLWEGLVRNDVFDPAFGKIPAMAERWDVSPDGKTWTFHIRSNSGWCNGAPFSANSSVGCFFGSIFLSKKPNMIPPSNNRNAAAPITVG